jgi:5-methyltetrahydropteroyltriglutamate--homocysteine methyltransferase
MPETRPPYRADMVGSLLRPAPLKEARAKHASHALGVSELKRIEDAEITKAIAKQEAIGLQLATDGEFRRAWWHFDFFAGLGGVEIYEAEQGIQFRGMQTKPQAVRVVGKLAFPDHHPMLDHFRFLKEHTRVTAKMTIPSPSVLHFRGGRASISRTAYPEMDAFFADLGAVYGKAIGAFYAAGCRYLQLDDTVWAYLCSQEQCEQARSRGEDVDELPAIYARTINAALKSRPPDMVITTHVCRGNFRSTWISEGGYEPVAEQLLGGVDYDGFFLEYDTDRAGGFEPLRFLPKGNKRVVVGLVTSKTGKLESRQEIERRLEEAARYAPLAQLCLSPQCGFASTEEGNVLSQEEQWAKLARIVEVAAKVWG